MDKLAITLFL